MAATRAIEETPYAAAWLLDIEDKRAVGVELVGAKASNLAKALAAGLSVLPGFVITTAAPGREALDDPCFRTQLKRRWAAASADGTSRIVVRSSSVDEDGVESSMAGIFRSITNVTSWNDFLAAVEQVTASSMTPLRDRPAPMAVLVQRQLDPVVSGVMFGVDPVTGRRNRIVVAVVEGAPEELVSGGTNGTRYVITRRGRSVERIAGENAVELSRGQRRRLASLAHRAADHFGGPQDIEWAQDDRGHLWMLQSRPVTTTAEEVTGPLLGPGPVAETFPNPLSPLEQDLWLEPMHDGLKGALSVAGIYPRRRVASSPLALAVGGRAAVDLELLGEVTKNRTLLARLDPRPPARRLAASWRVGRLRAVIPAITGDLLARCDDELGSIGVLAQYDEQDLVALLRRSRQLLTSLHGHEALAGILMAKGATTMTSAEIGLRALAEARREGIAEQRIVSDRPEVLALFPPAIAPAQDPPPVPAGLGPVRRDVDPGATAREALRFSARLVQELSARAALELGRREGRAGRLRRAEDIKWLRLGEVEATTRGEFVPLDLPPAGSHPQPPLPAAFRLTASGTVVPEQSAASGKGGQGAGGGRALGSVREAKDVQPGDVLVVPTLDPQLAGVLPGLGGLISETGSVLSHLAIMAREFGVATVVGVPGAVDRFPPGSTLIVDGLSGEVSLVSPDEAGS